MGNATCNELILTRTAYCTLALGFCISLYSRCTKSHCPF